MKRFTTIVACIAFAIFGIGLARYGAQHGVGPPGHTLSANAQELLTEWKLPSANIVQPFDARLFESKEQLSLNPVENSATTGSDSILIDSLQSENEKLTAKICLLEKQRQVNNAEGRGSPAPKPVVKFRTVVKTVKDTVTVRDTVREQVYLATQTGTEKPDGCVSVYELKYVKDICPEPSSSEGEMIESPYTVDE